MHEFLFILSKVGDEIHKNARLSKTSQIADIAGELRNDFASDCN